MIKERVTSGHLNRGGEQSTIEPPVKPTLDAMVILMLLLLHRHHSQHKSITVIAGSYVTTLTTKGFLPH